MMKLFTLLAVAIPVVHDLPQAPLPSAGFPANASLYASISSAVTSANLRLYVTPLSTNEITEWSALGDSFTSGSRPNGLDDYQGSSQACRRYDKAYPMRMRTVDGPGMLRTGNSTLALAQAIGCKTFGVTRLVLRFQTNMRLLGLMTKVQLSDQAPEDYTNFGKP